MDSLDNITDWMCILTMVFLGERRRWAPYVCLGLLMVIRTYYRFQHVA